MPANRGKPAGPAVVEAGGATTVTSWLSYIRSELGRYFRCVLKAVRSYDGPSIANDSLTF